MKRVKQAVVGCILALTAGGVLSVLLLDLPEPAVPCASAPSTAPRRGAGDTPREQLVPRAAPLRAAPLRAAPFPRGRQLAAQAPAAPRQPAAPGFAAPAELSPELPPLDPALLVPGTGVARAHLPPQTLGAREGLTQRPEPLLVTPGAADGRAEPLPLPPLSPQTEPLSGRARPLPPPPSPLEALSSSR